MDQQMKDLMNRWMYSAHRFWFLQVFIKKYIHFLKPIFNFDFVPIYPKVIVSCCKNTLVIYSKPMSSCKQHSSEEIPAI